MTLRVLYLHFTGAFGGASRSLSEAVGSFPEGAVTPLFVTQRGSVRDAFGKLGEIVETRGLSQFDHTRYSHYRGLRWLVVLRELAFLPSTVIGLRRAWRKWRDVDLIHVNEFSGLIALRIARRWFDAPAVSHVRSVLNDDRRLLRTRWLHRMFRNDVQGVVAIDETVRASLPSDLAVQVIHNGFSPHSAERDPGLAASLGVLRSESFKVGFVGNLLRVKGIVELVEAARATRDAGLDVEFLIVGDDAKPSRGWKSWLLARLGLQQSVRAEVEALLDRYRLRDRVHLLGFTRDIGTAYARMDVVAFPSHYDAPGRPVFEAAFYGVPSIVAVREPRPDTIVPGVTGIAIEPGNVEQLAAAITRLANDRSAAGRMGEAARQMARSQFDARANAAKLLALYRHVCGREEAVSRAAPCAE